MNSPSIVTDPISRLSVGVSLPRYETNGDANPPSYSHAQPEPIMRERVEHVYYLTNSKDKPLATLKFRSAARSPEHIPVIFEGDVITGTFELDVNKDNIAEIAIVVGYLPPLHVG